MRIRMTAMSLAIFYVLIMSEEHESINLGSRAARPQKEIKLLFNLARGLTHRV